MIKWRMDYNFLKTIAGPVFNTTHSYNDWSTVALCNFATQYNCHYDIERHMLLCDEESFLVVKLTCPSAIGEVIERLA